MMEGRCITALPDEHVIVVQVLSGDVVII